MERVSIVRAAILVLPDDRRKALIWKYVEAFPSTLLPRVWEEPPSGRVASFRAREQVRGLLQGYMMPCGDGRRVSKESSMSDQFNSDDEVLARLVREAGDLHFTRPQYVEKLGDDPGRMGASETVAHVTEASRNRT